MKHPARLLSTLSVGLALGCSASFAYTAEADNSWQHRVILYGWFPTTSGTLKYDLPGGDEAEADASDIISNLSGVFMGAYEGQKGLWSVKTDLIYIDLSNTESNSVSIPVGPGSIPIDLEAKQSMSAWVVGLYGGYNIWNTEKLKLDLLAGLRYLSMDADAKLDISSPVLPTLPTLKLSRSADLWDGIIGVKGNYKINDKWFIPYHLDIGTGDSNLTWQAVGSIGYRFNNIDLLLSYRHLYYDQGGSKLIQGMSLSGPALGLSFSF